MRAAGKRCVAAGKPLGYTVDRLFYPVSFSANSHSYRPDVDGLRAVAVIAVVLFHADLGFPGGYTGVDVFFVISGFLITQLILRDLGQGRFSMLDFWERRARRILPALTVVAAFTLVAGYFLMIPVEYSGLARSVLALAAFSSNILFFRENSYFAPASESKPLLHTWSLSVEEQFYLFIPIFFWALWRFGQANRIFWVLAAMGALSLAISAIGVYWFSWATFLLLPTRAWELAVGSLLAFAKPVESRRVRQAMGTAGILGILAPFFLYSKTTPFPGLAAVPSVAGTALLIWAGMTTNHTERRTLVGALLEWKPFVWVGLLSYSFYLWHWPLLAFNHGLELWKDSVAVKAGLIVLAFGISWLSWKFVEQPFRGRGLVRTRRGIFLMSGGAVAATSLAAFLILKEGGLPNRGSEIVRCLMEVRAECAPDSSVTIRGRPGRLAEADIPEKMMRFGGDDDLPPRVFVWGDSHAEAALPGIDAACRNLGIGGRAAILRGVTPTEREANPLKKILGRRPHNENVLAHLRSEEARRDFRVVVLIARWSDQTGSSDFESHLAELATELRACGYEVVLLDEVPQWTASVSKALGLKRALGLDCPFETGAVRVVEGFESHRAGGIFQTSEKLRGLIRVIDPLPVFTASNGQVRAYGEEGPFFWDAGHLSFQGALRLVPLIDPVVAPHAP